MNHLRQGRLIGLRVALAATLLVGTAKPALVAEHTQHNCPYAGRKLTAAELKPILDVYCIPVMRQAAAALFMRLVRVVSSDFP